VPPVLPMNLIRSGLRPRNRVICCGMIDGLKLLACFVVSLFRSTGRLEAEIVILRHQLNVLRPQDAIADAIDAHRSLIFVCFIGCARPC